MEAASCIKKLTFIAAVNDMTGLLQWHTVNGHLILFV